MIDFGESLDNLSVLVYDEVNSETDGGVLMKSKELLDAVYKELGITQAEAAAAISWSPQQYSQKMVRGSLRADEFLAILENLGIELSLTVKDTGNAIRQQRAGAGRRVRAMVDRVKYDTATSVAMANSFYADGVNKYTDGKAMELYMDKENRYFFAEYFDWEGAKDRILPVTAEVAAAFIEKYGTEIHKEPSEQNADVSVVTE